MNINDLRVKQQLGASDPVSSLRTVEINPIDVCNRSCGFCPRSDVTVYPNTKGKISLDLINKIANDLAAINYTGRVSFVGFGEPLLYKDLVTAVTIIKTTVRFCTWIEINTNGDYLTKDLIKELEIAGCTNLTVSMYDSDITEQLNNLIDGCNIELTVKHCYSLSFKDSLINRSEIVTQAKILNFERPCYLPFYKMFIDFTGNVLICCNDWGRKEVVGNIVDMSVKDIWTSQHLTQLRNELKDGFRKNINPCKFCNIDGTKYGLDSFKVLTKSS
jgi:radical SAM protein with 4Fe4S-binding SPASM domain